MAGGNILLPSEGASGVQPDGRATATCFCGSVQLLLPVQGDGYTTAFVCHCSDCHKIHASAFASNFVVDEDKTTHTRGKELLTRYAQSKTIATGHEMANYFCSRCGTLMYRISSGYPGKLIPRIGTVDDYDVQSKQLKPQVEQFAKDKVAWLEKDIGVEVHQGGFFNGA